MHYRKISVEVTDKKHNGLTEYGEIKNKRAKLCSCFIQSETDKQFRIRIQPDESLLRRDNPIFKGAELDEYGREQEEWWHFLATLRLDGRAKYEKKSIINLDRNVGRVDEEDGEVFLEGPLVRDEDGGYTEYAWVFKDVGVDVVFEKLQLGGQNQGTSLIRPEEELADAFGAMSATKEDPAEEKSTVGQIEVRIDKITLGEWTEAYVPDPEKETEMEELRGSEVGDSEHTVGRIDGMSQPAPKRLVSYNRIEQDYAIFRFKYCDEKKLRKLGFLEPLPASNGKRADALKLAAAVQTKKPARGPSAFKFRNLGAGEEGEGSAGDEEVSEAEQDGGDEAGAPGLSQDLPLPGLGEALGALGLDRTRTREGEGEEDGEKKLRAE